MILAALKHGGRLVMKRTGIFYFTGTGNNMIVAEKLGDILNTQDIYPIKALNQDKNAIGNYERVIICAPSYHSHIPNYVEKVLKSVHFNKSQKVYSIVVCAGNRGHAIEDLRECVESNGCKVAGEYMVVLPGSYILSYGAFPDWVVKLENKISTSKIKRIAEEIASDKSCLIKKTGLLYNSKDEARLQKAISEYKIIGAAYSVSNSCVGCGICEKVCPINNIILEGGKPTFGTECQQCMACVQWCPNHAIDYENKASSRKRYHHPEITVKEVIFKNR